MADYPDEFIRQAQRTVGTLLESGEEAIADIEGEVPISDLETHASQFRAELEFARDIGLEIVPALSIGGQRIPMSLALAFDVPGLYPGLGWFSQAWPAPWKYEFGYGIGEVLRRDLRSRSEDEILPVDKARGAFLQRAATFLATRIAAVRNYESGSPDTTQSTPLLNIAKRRRGPRISTPGCNFSVSTTSSGLRVFWSGAYWINSNYFSSPTTPVSSVLQSGIYVFGVDGGAYGSQLQWDRSAVVTLPGTSHVHLNF